MPCSDIRWSPNSLAPSINLAFEECESEKVGLLSFAWEIGQKRFDSFPYVMAPIRSDLASEIVIEFLPCGCFSCPSLVLGRRWQCLPSSVGVPIGSGAPVSLVSYGVRPHAYIPRTALRLPAALGSQTFPSRRLRYGPNRLLRWKGGTAALFR